MLCYVLLLLRVQLLGLHSQTPYAAADPGFAQKGIVASLNGGLEPPAGSRGRARGGEFARSAPTPEA